MYPSSKSLSRGTRRLERSRRWCRPGVLASLLAAPVLLAALAALPTEAQVLPAPSTLPQGVAAGDITQNFAVLWAHSTARGPVTFELSVDPSFSTSVQHRTVNVGNPGRPAKAAFGRLKTGSQYYYRATNSVGDSASGSFRTLSPIGQFHGTRFGVSGDSRGDLKPFRAITNVAERNLDFFVNLGDTIYADIESPALPGVAQATSLGEFRTKHAEVLSDGSTQGFTALRSSTAVFSTIDDHEVTNDFAGGASPDSDPRFMPGPAEINQTPLFENGLQAFLEYQPIAGPRYDNPRYPGNDGRVRLYRRRFSGRDAAFFLLDTRSFRDSPIQAFDPTQPADAPRFLAEAFTPGRTMLEENQILFLLHDLYVAERLGVTWKLPEVQA